MTIDFSIDAELASEINKSFLELDSSLNELLRRTRPELSVDDFDTLRKSVSDVLGITYLDFMVNIYRKQPQIKPDGMP